MGWGGRGAVFGLVHSAHVGSEEGGGESEVALQSRGVVVDIAQNHQEFAPGGGASGRGWTLLKELCNSNNQIIVHQTCVVAANKFRFRFGF